MDLSIEEVIRRLLLLGLPLVPLGCSGGELASGLPDATVEIDGGTGGDGPGGAVAGTGGFATAGTSGAGGTGGNGIPVGRCGPEWDMLGGSVTATANEVTPAAWNACLDSGDCGALCQQVGAKLTTQPPALGGFAVDSCQRIDPPLSSDAGADGGDASVISDAGADVDANGGQKIVVLIEGRLFHVCGRRPAGLAPTRAPAGRTDVGAWLARAATLEAASVPAFQRLARELAAHGAPARLIAAARGAAREEARHFALMRRLARAHGSEPRRPRVRALPVRPLLALARENAREGCVRETFGAMVAAHQATHARDAAVRGAMAAIAVDEARHAQLAWEVDAWARATLPRDEARAVARARRTAATRLLRDLDREDLPHHLAQTLGLPEPLAAKAHAQSAHSTLWSA
jgi:hypothetical protein